MKDTKPRFSIVIPCYNEARFIDRTLSSLAKQSYSGSYEVIVVDNNCTDETVDIAETYGAKIVKEKRPGVCWARQAGTDAAKGEIVISTDADTVQPDNWLENIDNAFKHNDNSVAVAGPCIYEDGPWWGKQYPKIMFGLVAALYRLTGAPLYVTATNIAFKKSAWSQYNTSMTQGGDELALLHDLRSKGKVVFNNSNPVYTSGRRLTRGLFYNIFVTFFTYYLLAYYINRLTGRTVIGMAPAYRTLKPSRNRLSLVYKIVVVVLVVAFVHLPGHDSLWNQAYETFRRVKRSF